ncbi:hypothetical protein KGQ24_01945 [Patescibacteria group bacterium]|nr:hypothetical protein [Patescibacteria group bacterium]
MLQIMIYSDATMSRHIARLVGRIPLRQRHTEPKVMSAFSELEEAAAKKHEVVLILEGAFAEGIGVERINKATDRCHVVVLGHQEPPADLRYDHLVNTTVTHDVSVEEQLRMAFRSMSLL